METNILNETSISDVSVAAETMAETTVNTNPVDNAEVSAEATDPTDPNHPQHHHNSALHAASLGHSAVNHVHPHHRGIDL